MTVALQTTNLMRRFGGLIATNDVSITRERGARHALIGPNGAGKTTLINLLTGVITPTSGTIMLGWLMAFAFFSNPSASLRVLKLPTFTRKYGR